MSTLPHLGQSPLMTKSASSLASSSPAPSPLKRLDARVGSFLSFGLRFSLFLAGGLHAQIMQLMIWGKSPEPSQVWEYTKGWMILSLRRDAAASSFAKSVLRIRHPKALRASIARKRRIAATSFDMSNRCFYKRRYTSPSASY